MEVEIPIGPDRHQIPRLHETLHLSGALDEGEIVIIGHAELVVDRPGGPPQALSCGIGLSQHSGMMVVLDGSELTDERIERVFKSDPGTGVMRHADAGYDLAIKTAKEKGVKLPMLK